jgi:hypothetical protein
LLVKNKMKNYISGEGRMAFARVLCWGIAGATVAGGALAGAVELGAAILSGTADESWKKMHAINYGCKDSNAYDSGIGSWPVYVCKDQAGFNAGVEQNLKNHYALYGNVALWSGLAVGGIGFIVGVCNGLYREAERTRVNTAALDEQLLNRDIERGSVSSPVSLFGPSLRRASLAAEQANLTPEQEAPHAPAVQLSLG